MGKDYVTANAAAMKKGGGTVNNYDDLDLIKRLYPKTNEYKDVDEWIEQWGSDRRTQEGFKMTTLCALDQPTKYRTPRIEVNVVDSKDGKKLSIVMEGATRIAVPAILAAATLFAQ